MWTDIKCAWRSLRSHGALTATALLVLAAGLGFNAAAFGIVKTLMFRPYPYPNLSRLFLLRDQRLAEGAHEGNTIASGDLVDLQRETTAFDGISGLRGQPMLLTGSGEPERIEGLAVSVGFFDLLGVHATVGRTFIADEGQAGRDDGVVISHRYWKNRFGQDSTVVGRTFLLNGRPTRLIGIIADADCYPPGIDAWVPLVLTPAEQTERASQTLQAIGRIKDRVTREAARQDAGRVGELLQRRYPTTNAGRTFSLLELRQEQYEYTGPIFTLVQVAAILVLLLGSANVINLLLARTFDRRREFGVRFALGASRARVFIVTLAEAITVAAAAGIAGVLIAAWSVPLIHAALPEGISRWVAGWQQIDVDGGVVATTAGLAVLTGAALGSITGWDALRATNTETLRDGGRTLAPRLSLGRRGLIVSEVVFALVLLLAAGGIFRGFQHLAASFGTFAPEQVLRFRLALSGDRYPDTLRIVDFQNRFLQRIGELPGVKAAGLIRNEPASNVPNPQTPFTIEGQPVATPADISRVDVQTISAGGFAAVPVPATRGRVFTTGDAASTPAVAVISEEMARRFWPNADPIGALIHVGAQSAPAVTIVGVVKDLKLNWSDAAPRPTLYLPNTQMRSPQMYVLVRSAAAPDTLASAIRAIGASLDPQQPLGQMQRMDDVVRESLSPVRVLGLVLTIGAVLAIAFAASGIYGVLAHWVTSRWRDFGIRVALGATAGEVGRLVLGQALALGVVGLAIGLPCGIAALWWLQSWLFGVATIDIPTTVVMSAFVLAIVVLAALVPTQRVLRADPTVLLHSE